MTIAGRLGDAGTMPKAGEPVLDGLVSLGCLVFDFPILPRWQGWRLTRTAGVKKIREAVFEAADIIGGIGRVGVGLGDLLPGGLREPVVAVDLVNSRWRDAVMNRLDDQGTRGVAEGSTALTADPKCQDNGGYFKKPHRLSPAQQDSLTKRSTLRTTRLLDSHRFKGGKGFNG